MFVSHSQLGPFSHWTLDISVRQISSASGLCVVGLSNNSISVFCITASADDCHAKVCRFPKESLSCADMPR